MRTPSKQEESFCEHTVITALKKGNRDHIQRPVDKEETPDGEAITREAIKAANIAYSVPSLMRPSAQMKQESSRAVATLATTGRLCKSYMK